MSDVAVQAMAKRVKGRTAGMSKQKESRTKLVQILSNPKTRDFSTHRAYRRATRRADARCARSGAADRAVQ
jgi:hypothetical protein